MSDYGTLNINGVEYTLTDQASVTNRVFPGCFSEPYADGTYISEWEAPALAPNGDSVQLRWRFDAVKGEEPEDDGEWPWDQTPDVINA